MVAESRRGAARRRAFSLPPIPVLTVECSRRFVVAAAPTAVVRKQLLRFHTPRRYFSSVPLFSQPVVIFYNSCVCDTLRNIVSYAPSCFPPQGISRPVDFSTLFYMEILQQSYKNTYEYTMKYKLCVKK